jgi:hypothetical protein
MAQRHKREVDRRREALSAIYNAVKRLHSFLFSLVHQSESKPRLLARDTYPAYLSYAQLRRLKKTNEPVVQRCEAAHQVEQRLCPLHLLIDGRRGWAMRIGGDSLISRTKFAYVFMPKRPYLW